MILPGGHAPGMRQYLGSALVQHKVAEFWEFDRPIGAICHGRFRYSFVDSCVCISVVFVLVLNGNWNIHSRGNIYVGVLVLARSNVQGTDQSVLKGATATCLPAVRIFHQPILQL